MDGRLFVTVLSVGQIFSVKTDGTDKRIIVTECKYPDGIAIDPELRHVYWTEMGHPKMPDGSIERVDFDGKNRRTIISRGSLFTPKQLFLDRENRKLYWAEREGMCIRRSNTDGTDIETLYLSGETESERLDPKNWCVGVAVDVKGGHIYWTQKGYSDSFQGRLFRMKIEIPIGEIPNARSDVECLYQNLPEPIDIDLDIVNRHIYWTDRGDPPNGNTLNRAPMNEASNERSAPVVIADHLMEGVGLALDVKNQRVFLTDLGGSVYSAKMDGSGKQAFLWVQGNLAGVAYLESDDG